jgi:HipA-like kinase
MLEKLTIARFGRRITAGRTKPCIVYCNLADGGEFEAVVKLKAGCETGAGGLLAEAVAAQLAMDLDLPVPQGCLLEITKDFAEAMMDEIARPAFLKSVGWNFGSKKLPPQFATIPIDRLLRINMRQAAAEIFAFDAMIQNPDRRRQNPNCLACGDELMIYDHELGFSIGSSVIGWKPPWEHDSLKFLRDHVFFKQLSGLPFDFNRLIGAWEGIDSSRIKSYFTALPDEWQPAGGRAIEIRDYLLQLKQYIPKVIETIGKALK